MRLKYGRRLQHKYKRQRYRPKHYCVIAETWDFPQGNMGNEHILKLIKSISEELSCNWENNQSHGLQLVKSV
jgi:hypothetical protein